MKTTKDKPHRESSKITTNSELDQYKDKNLFPEKLAKANKMLRTAKLPDIKDFR